MLLGVGPATFDEGLGIAAAVVRIVDAVVFGPVVARFMSRTVHRAIITVELHAIGQVVAWSVQHSGRDCLYGYGLRRRDRCGHCGKCALGDVGSCQRCGRASRGRASPCRNRCSLNLISHPFGQRLTGNRQAHGEKCDLGLQARPRARQGRGDLATIGAAGQADRLSANQRRLHHNPNNPLSSPPSQLHSPSPLPLSRTPRLSRILRPLATEATTPPPGR